MRMYTWLPVWVSSYSAVNVVNMYTRAAAVFPLYCAGESSRFRIPVSRTGADLRHSTALLFETVQQPLHVCVYNWFRVLLFYMTTPLYLIWSEYTIDGVLIYSYLPLNNIKYRDCPACIALRCRHTGGRNSSIIAMRPYMPTSISGFNPSAPIW